MRNVNLTDKADNYGIFTKKSNEISTDLWTRILKLQGPYDEVKLSNEDINPPAVVISKSYIHFNNLANSIDSTLIVEPQKFMMVQYDGNFISSFADVCIKTGILEGKMTKLEGVDYRKLSNINTPDMINLFINNPDNKPTVMSKEDYCATVKNANNEVGKYFTKGYFSQHNKK